MKKPVILLAILLAVGALHQSMKVPTGEGGKSEVAKTKLGDANPRQICRNRENEAFRISKETIRKTLRAPASAKFASEPASVLNTDWCSYLVVAHVDAQNASGTTLRSRYSLDLKFHHTQLKWYSGNQFLEDPSLTTLADTDDEKRNVETLFEDMSKDMKGVYLYGSVCNKTMRNVVADHMRKIDDFQGLFTEQSNLVDNATLQQFEDKIMKDNDPRHTSLLCGTLLEKHIKSFNANSTRYNVVRGPEWPQAPLLAIPDWGLFE